MPVQSTAKNGHRPISWTQAGVGANRATPGFGSQNVAMTAADSQCRIDVVQELFPSVLEDLQRTGTPREPVTTDELDVSRLTEAALAGLTPLWQADATIPSSERILAIVQSAKQSQPRETTAQLLDAATCVAERAIEEVRARIHRLSDSPPATLRSLGLELLKVLSRLKPVPRDAARLIEQAASAVERAKVISARDTSLASIDRAFVTGQLHDWARRSVREAFHALVAELVAHELTKQWSALTDSAQSLLSLAGESVGRIDALQRIAADWAHQERLALSQPVCTTIVSLPGTPAEEAVAGLLVRHRLVGRRELVRYLIDRWLTALRKHLQERVTFDPETAGALQVLAAVPPTTAFAEFRSLLEWELQPEIRTVYGRLREFGLPEALQRLLDRSALTSDPGPRASTRFKLNVYRIRVVSLPQVVQLADQPIRQELLRWLEQAGDVELVEHAAAFDEVVVHQIGGGWPWQILPSNRHLRDQYLTAAEAGHRPHLVGVFSQSPMGEVVPAYRRLKAHEENGYGGQ